jgi:hypothetical protein
MQFKEIKPQKKGNKKYDNSALKKINGLVAFAARGAFYPACACLFWAFAHSKSGYPGYSPDARRVLSGLQHSGGMPSPLEH